MRRYINTAISFLKHLKDRKFIISLVLLLTLVFFLYTAVKEKKLYIANLIFVVDENKQGASSNFASLAGQFGLDIASASSSSLLSSENIFTYFKSRSLIIDVLHDTLNSDSVSVIQRYYSLFRQNEDLVLLNKLLNASNSIGTKRQLDSMMQDAASDVIKNFFTISKVERRSSFYEVKVLSESEFFSYSLCNLLVKKAVENYLAIKIKRQRDIVMVFENKVDSLRILLSKDINSEVALKVREGVMDINPLYSSETLITSQNLSREKSIVLSSYLEAVRGLQNAKFTLAQETPVIQIVDSPLYPLSVKKANLVYRAFFIFIPVIILLILILFIEWGTKKYYHENHTLR